MAERTREREQRRTTERSRELHEAALDVLPGGVSHNVRYRDPYPIYVDRSEGPYLWDADGNRYVDHWMNHGASLLGHAHPDVVEAVTEQAERGLHYGALTESAVDLGRRVRDFVPSAERIRFCASGTEATMYAVRLARAITGRNRILKLEGGWHGGNTDLSVAVSPPFDAPTTAGLPPGAAEHVHAFRLNDRESVESLLTEHRGEVAGLILDPRRGGLTPDREFIDFLVDASEDRGFLLIFDEVVSGFRFSPGSYGARVGVDPDLTTMGKIVGGGLPVGALAGRADLFDVARPDVDIGPNERVIAGGGTFTMNPMTAAAGLATLAVIDREPVYEHTESLGQRVRDGLEATFEAEGVDAEVLGESSLFTVAFAPERPITTPGDIATGSDTAARLDFHRRLAERGYYFNPGSMGNVAHAVTDEHVEGLIHAAAAAVRGMRDDGVV